MHKTQKIEKNIFSHRTFIFFSQLNVLKIVPVRVFNCMKLMLAQLRRGFKKITNISLTGLTTSPSLTPCMYFFITKVIIFFLTAVQVAEKAPFSPKVISETGLFFSLPGWLQEEVLIWSRENPSQVSKPSIKNSLQSTANQRLEWIFGCKVSNLKSNFS